MATGLPPAPAETELSIAERHGRIVLFSGVAGVLLAAPFAFFAPTLFWVIFLGSVAVPFVVAYFLKRRFVDEMIRADIHVEPSTRNVPSKVSAHHGWFVANGFVSTPPYMIVSDSGTILGQPSLAYRRPGTIAVATAHSVGVHFNSLLTDGRWLVTSSGPVIPHPSLIIQRVTGDVGRVFAVHEQGLGILAQRGIGEAPHELDPLGVALELERIERHRLITNKQAGGTLGTLVREAKSRGVGTLADGTALELGG